MNYCFGLVSVLGVFPVYNGNVDVWVGGYCACGENDAELSRIDEGCGVSVHFYIAEKGEP